jgi:hypothetical protein
VQRKGGGDRVDVELARDAAAAGLAPQFERQLADQRVGRVREARELHLVGVEPAGQAARVEPDGHVVDHAGAVPGLPCVVGRDEADGTGEVGARVTLAAFEPRFRAGGRPAECHEQQVVRQPAVALGGRAALPPGQLDAQTWPAVLPPLQVPPARLTDSQHAVSVRPGGFDAREVPLPHRSVIGQARLTRS